MQNDMGRALPTSLSALLQLLTLAAAVILIIVIPWKLFDTNVDTNVDEFNIDVDNRCYLSPRTDRKRYCAYGIAVGVVAVLFLVFLSCVTCITNTCCFGFGGVFTGIGQFLLLVWFATAAAIIVPKARNANDLGIRERHSRIAVMTVLICGSVFSGLAIFTEFWRSRTTRSTYKRRHTEEVA